MALNHRLVLQTIVAYASFIAGHHFAATEINAPAQPTLKCERGQGVCTYEIRNIFWNFWNPPLVLRKLTFKSITTSHMGRPLPGADVKYVWVLMVA